MLQERAPETLAERVRKLEHGKEIPGLEGDRDASWICAGSLLNKACYLKERVESKCQQIAYLDSMTKRMTSCIQPDVVSHSRDVTAGENAMVRLMEARDELAEQISELLDARKVIQEVIDLVDDDQYRLVLEKKYLCHMKNEEIAADMNISAKYVYQLLRRAIGRVQELFF